MDELENLDNLPIWPHQMAKKIRAARGAMMNQGDAIHRTYRTLSFVAELLASICRNVWQLGACWLILLVLLRLLRLDWSLPPGPWWNWTMLLEFSTDLLVRTTLLLALVIASLTLACRAAARHLYFSLRRSTSPRSRWLATGQALLLAGSTPLAVGSVDLATPTDVRAELDCRASWSVSSLGESWWLLQCPVAEDPSAECRIKRGAATESFAPGRRVVMSSGRVERMEFTGSVGDCATLIQLVDEKPPEQHVDFRLALPPQVTHISHPPGERSAVDALDRFGDKLVKAVAQIPRRIEVTKPEARPPIPEELLTRLVASQESAAKEASERNRLEAEELRLRTSCETTRRAMKFNKRADMSIRGDKDCLEAIERYKADVNHGR